MGGLLTVSPGLCGSCFSACMAFWTRWFSPPYSTWWRSRTGLSAVTRPCGPSWCMGAAASWWKSSTFTCTSAEAGGRGGGSPSTSASSTPGSSPGVWSWGSLTPAPGIIPIILTTLWDSSPSSTCPDGSASVSIRTCCLMSSWGSSAPKI